MTLYFPTDHTADEWRAMARNRRQKVTDSWDQSDTDGFMSQWAGGVMSVLYNFLADIALTGGKGRLRMLADLDGNLLDAKEVKTRYGYAWVVNKPDGSVEWFNESEAKSAKTRIKNNAAKGYKFMLCEQDVVVGLTDGISPRPYALPKRGTEPVVIGDYQEDDFDE